MRKDNKPIAKRDDLVIQELKGEVLIYNLSDNKAFCLNETSALVWQACNGERTVAEIGGEVSKKLNSPVNEDLVWLALDQLKKENLLEAQKDFQIDFNGMSRRDVIKKIGLASVIALPLVSSLIAPTPASAQSRVCSGGCTCIGTPGNNTSCTFTPTATCRAGCVCTSSNGSANPPGTCA